MIHSRACTPAARPFSGRVLVIAGDHLVITETRFNVDAAARLGTLVLGFVPKRPDRKGISPRAVQHLRQGSRLPLVPRLWLPFPGDMSQAQLRGCSLMPARSSFGTIGVSPLLPLEDTVAQKLTSKSAKMLYRPIGLISGMLGGLIASQVYRQVWKRVGHDDRNEAPKALSTE